MCGLAGRVEERSRVCQPSLVFTQVSKVCNQPKLSSYIISIILGEYKLVSSKPDYATESNHKYVLLIQLSCEIVI